MTPTVSTPDVMQALGALQDPLSGQPWLATKALRDVQVSADGQVSMSLVLGYPAQGVWDDYRQRIAQAVQAVPGVSAVSVAVRTEVVAHQVQRGVPLLPGVKNIVAVASGKGGVGQSTTTAKLALALAAEGDRVVILDADIYGPSQPTMMGIEGRPESEDGKTMLPLMGHGVQVMSIGFLVDKDQAMIWRGPMATQALDQLLRQTLWQDLDYLLVDMPPGTGDIQLTLSQRVPLTGSVIVTTPQDIALLDARKGIAMFQKVGVPILGVAENMAVYCCPQCGHTEAIFGADGGQRMAQELGLPHLGALPLTLAIREHADQGRPTVVAEPDGAVAALYRNMARQLAVAVAGQAKDFSSRFPTITVSADT